MTAGSVFRIGLLRLTDTAPLIVARQRGYFAAEGLEVALSVEPSWANIADKLSYGLLDGAMLPPLALALRFGLSGSAGPEQIIVPAALSLDGNTVTLSKRWSAAVAGGDTAALGKLSAVETAQRFATVLRQSRETASCGGSHVFDA